MLLDWLRRLRRARQRRCAWCRKPVDHPAWLIDGAYCSTECAREHFVSING